MKLPIAQIKNTPLRRAAMVAFAPFAFIWMLPSLCLLFGVCIGAAWDGFFEEWGFQTDHVGVRLLKAAWTQMWSVEWKNET